MTTKIGKVATRRIIASLQLSVKTQLDGMASSLPKRTYTSLLGEYYGLSNVKKLSKFREKLGQFTSTVNTITKIKQEKVIVNEAKRDLKIFLHNTTKVVSLFLTLYRPYNSNQNVRHSTREIIIYNGTEYAPLSKINKGNFGSFYLYRVSKLVPQILFNALSKWTYTLGEKMIGKKNSTYHILNDFDGQEDFFQNLKYAMTSEEDILVVMSELKIDDVKDEPINYATIEARDDVGACPCITIKDYIKNPYIKISNDISDIVKQLYKSEYVQENYRPRSCWSSTLLDIYKEPIEKYSSKTHKNKLTLTYQTLHQMIRPDTSLNLENNPYRFCDVENFFKYWKLAVYVFDINLNVKIFYEPEKRTKHINPEVIYVLLHDGHIYHLNDNLKRLEQKLKYHIEKLQAVCSQPNSKYFVKELNEQVDVKLIENKSELINIINDKEISGEINILFNEESCIDLWYYLYNNGINASVQMSGGKIDFTSMRLMQNDKMINVHTYKQEGVIEHRTFINQDTFQYYVGKNNWAKNHLLTKNYMSSYSDNVKQMLDYYKIGPLVGGFEHFDFEKAVFKNPDDVKWDCVQLDFNKYYAGILMNLKLIPVVNSFDEFVDYDGHILQDFNLYFVQKLESGFAYPMNRYSLCYGTNIRDLKHLKIISYLQVSKVKDNLAKEIVDNLYKDDKLEIKMKKDIINHIIGKYNKAQNTRHYTSISTDIREANSIRKDYGGRIIPIAFDDKEFHINYVESKQELSEGFRLIALFIYDSAHKILLNLKAKVESYGLEVYKCNTDCLYIEKDSEKLERLYSENKELFSFTHKDHFDAIGKLKHKDDTIRPYNLIRTNNYYNIYSSKVDCTCLLKLQDEFDRDALSRVIDKTDNLIIEADIAGAGKTSAFIYNAVKNADLKTLFVTPYNALCLDLRLKGMDSITLDKLLGNRFDGISSVQGTGSYCVDGIHRIVFDEIYLYDLFKLEQIKKFIVAHRDVKFNATGDSGQLKPIQCTLAVPNTKLYYKQIISSMFPNRIVLHENKRCSSPEDRKTMKQLTNDIRNAKTKAEIITSLVKHNIKIVRNQNEINSKKNICALNKTCEYVNNYWANKIHQNGMYEIGQELICRKTLKLKGGNKTFVNYTYTIMAIQEETMTIDDGENSFDIATDNIIKYFKLPYARTCHSMQGMSIEEEMTIYDINHFMCDNEWIYTAITRATKLENIVVYLGNIKNDGLSELKTQIDSMIDGHINADLYAKRDIVGEYITSNWVLNKLKKTQCCKYCNKMLDVSTVDCFSVDRIDNNLAHTKMNCQIICRHCNVSKK